MNRCGITALELARLALQMRRAQKLYFRTRSQGDLEESRRRERELDRALDDILTQPTLFGE